MKHIGAKYRLESVSALLEADKVKLAEETKKKAEAIKESPSKNQKPFNAKSNCQALGYGNSKGNLNECMFQIVNEADTQKSKLPLNKKIKQQSADKHIHSIRKNNDPLNIMTDPLNIR